MKFLQYPATLVISVLIILTGLAWPYKDIWSNVLDLVLSADAIFLLLLRNTGHFEAIFNDVGVKKKDLATSDQCMMVELQPLALSYVLIPVYFLPLLLSVIALSLWIILLVRLVFIIVRFLHIASYLHGIIYYFVSYLAIFLLYYIYRKKLSKANRNDLLELDGPAITEESMQARPTTRSELLLVEFAPESENYATIDYISS